MTCGGWFVWIGSHRLLCVDGLGDQSTSCLYRIRPDGRLENLQAAKGLQYQEERSREKRSQEKRFRNDSKMTCRSKRQSGEETR
jgi:hypothetical protein